MMAFDATSREICTVRRIRTNTPLAALVTLNDPAFVEAAQLFDHITFRQFRRVTLYMPKWIQERWQLL